MPAQTESRPDGRVVVLTGELSIAGAAELQRALVAALAEPGSVALDLGSVESLDVAAMQVLVAARRAASAAGRTLAIAVPPSAEIATWCALAGLPEVLA